MESLAGRFGLRQGRARVKHAPMTRRSFLLHAAAGAFAFPALSRDAVPGTSTLAVIERNGQSFAVAEELAEAGIAVKELPGQQLATVCFEDRCGTIKEFRREVRNLYAMIGPMAKTLGLKAEFSADRSAVSFGLEPRTEPTIQIPIRTGQLMPDFQLARLDGKPVSLSSFRGKRVMIVSWASWCVSRNDLQVWERVHQRYKSREFEVIAIAADGQGPSAARAYSEKQRVTFTVAIDATDVFGRLLGLKDSPFSAFVDEVGILRFTAGGPIPATVQRIDAVLREPVISIRGRTPKLVISLSKAELQKRVAESPGDWEARLALARTLDAAGKPADAMSQIEAAAKLKPQSAQVQFTWGVMLVNQRLLQPALAKWKQARDLEPDNLRIQRNIWAVESPEKFYRSRLPDLDWQKEQVTKEKPARR